MTAARILASPGVQFLVYDDVIGTEPCVCMFFMQPAAPNCTVLARGRLSWIAKFD